jgi:hypothetical protein
MTGINMSETIKEVSRLMFHFTQLFSCIILRDAGL